MHGQFLEPPRPDNGWFREAVWPWLRQCLAVAHNHPHMHVDRDRLGFQAPGIDECLNLAVRKGQPTEPDRDMSTDRFDWNKRLRRDTRKPSLRPPEQEQEPDMHDLFAVRPVPLRAAFRFRRRRLAA